MTAKELATARDLIARARIVSDARLQTLKLAELRARFEAEDAAERAAKAVVAPHEKRGAVRYATREEAQEAKRRSWVESKRRAAARRLVVLMPRPCGFCEETFTPSKYVSNATYCSVSCRNRAYYRRNQERLRTYHREYARAWRAA